jgi:hypothetical protein
MTMTTKTCQDNHFLLWPKLRKDDYKGRHRTSTATAAPATLIATPPPAATSFFACDKRAELKLLAWMGARASAPQLTEIIQRQSAEPRAPWQIPLDGHSRAAAPTTPTWTTSRCATSTWKVSDLAADLKWEKVLHHHNLEVTTLEANIYDVTSQPRPSKPAPDATDMGILIETNSSPQKTSESHQPGGKVRKTTLKTELIGSPGTHSNPNVYGRFATRQIG